MSAIKRLGISFFSKETRQNHFIASIFLAFSSLLVQLTNARAFGTGNGLGQHSEYEMVTGLAF